MGRSKRRTYKREATLVAAFARRLRSGESPWGPARIGFEFDYGSGSADVLGVFGSTIVAFEGKLTKWREALHQAYRTLCFAQRAFVVLPPATAAIAVACASEFHRRRVGLCTIDDDDRVVVLIDSPEGPPLLPWLAERAASYVTGRGDRCQQIQSSSKSPQPSAQLAA